MKDEAVTRAKLSKLISKSAKRENQRERETSNASKARLGNQIMQLKFRYDHKY